MKALLKKIANLFPVNKNDSTFPIKNNKKHQTSLVNSGGIENLPKKNISNQKNFSLLNIEKNLPELPKNLPELPKEDELPPRYSEDNLYIKNADEIKIFLRNESIDEQFFGDECAPTISYMKKLWGEEIEMKKNSYRSESIYSENNLFFESIVEPEYDRKIQINLDELVYEPKHDIDAEKHKKILK